MIRTTLLWALIAFGCGYAFVNWFRALLLLILLMAVYQHPDMPRSLAGIPGMNPWNLLLIFVCAGWIVNRGQGGFAWDFPKGTLLLLLAYAGVMLVSSFRAIRDPDIVPLTAFVYESMGAIVGDMLINTFKWMILPILLFDGCRDERRLSEALWCVLAIYVLIALQVAKYMPPQYAVDGEALQYRAIRVLQKGVGYHRVNLSVMLAGASWALFCARGLLGARWMQWALSATCLMILYAQGMTAGRAGYVAWALVGLTLCVLKWRRYLVAVPLVAGAIVLFIPAVTERMLEGFTEETRDSNTLVEQDQFAQEALALGNEADVDAYTVTAGRILVWPRVIAEIRESMWVGYGRAAMLRQGITQDLRQQYQEAFNHPHNAYLELLLDTGIIGTLGVLPFFVLIAWRSVVLFRDDRSPAFVAVGGACLAIVLSLLYGALGSQSFYPREGWVGMWCLIGLMLRMHVQRARALRTMPAVAPRRAVVPQALHPVRRVPSPAKAAAASPVAPDLWLQPSVRPAARRLPAAARGFTAGPPVRAR